MREITRPFKALSDSNRIRILKILEIRPLCVCEIQEILGLSASTVSKHLSILRDAGFILDQKEKKWVNYYLNEKADNALIKEIMGLVKSKVPANDIIKQDAKKARKVDRNKLCKS